MSSQVLIELLHGKGSHVDPIACIEDVRVELANRHAERLPHTIADLLFHMNYWMNYELRRIRGERPKYPEHNAESFPSTSASAEQWDALKSDFSRLVAEYEKLAHLSSGELHREIEFLRSGDKPHSSTLEAILWQMVAHNSYHIGQIAQLRRALGAWPPEAGGDTW